MRSREGVTAIGLALVFLCGLARSAYAGGSDVTIGVAIDVDTTGNGDNVLGPTEACNATPLQVGATIDVDIVLRGVPDYLAGTSFTGIEGFDFDLVFDPSVLKVTKIHLREGPTILGIGTHTGFFEFTDYNYKTDPNPPGVTGASSAAMNAFGQEFVGGDGMLTRVTLEAVGVGASRLDLLLTSAFSDQPQVYDAPEAANVYPVDESDATIIVGSGTCGAATPTAFPFATPAPTVAVIATSTVSPPPSVAVTPRALPPTGGPSGGASVWPATLGAVIVLASSIGALAFARRRL